MGNRVAVPVLEIVIGVNRRLYADLNGILPLGGILWYLLEKKKIYCFPISFGLANGRKK